MEGSRTIMYLCVRMSVCARVSVSVCAMWNSGCVIESIKRYISIYIIRFLIKHQVRTMKRFSTLLAIPFSKHFRIL